MNKNKSKERRGKIILINASQQFEKGRPKNFIPDEKITKIAKAFHDWKNVKQLAKIITVDEAAKNDYNLSPSRYVETGAAEEYADIPELLEELASLEQEGSRIDSELKAIFVKLRLTIKR